jgi:hypothetical protein
LLLCHVGATRIATKKTAKKAITRPAADFHSIQVTETLHKRLVHGLELALDLQKFGATMLQLLTIY